MEMNHKKEAEGEMPISAFVLAHLEYTASTHTVPITTTTTENGIKYRH